MVNTTYYVTLLLCLFVSQDVSSSSIASHRVASPGPSSFHRLRAPTDVPAGDIAETFLPHAPFGRVSQAGRLRVRACVRPIDGRTDEQVGCMDGRMGGRTWPPVAAAAAALARTPAT